MDRRMYRGNMSKNCGSNRNMSPYRHNDSMCDDITEGFTSDDMCERDDHESGLDRFPIGMCYVPWQCFRNLYENEFTAMAKGTIFKELDLEWYGRGCK